MVVVVGSRNSVEDQRMTVFSFAFVWLRGIILVLFASVAGDGSDDQAQSSVATIVSKNKQSSGRSLVEVNSYLDSG